MKKLTFLTLILLLLGGLVPLRAQNLAQMALEQVEQKVKLPETVTLLDSALITQLNLDKVIMQMPVKRNGRIAAHAVTFLNPSITPINDLFMDAVKKVRLPKELVSAGDTLTVGWQVEFKFICYFDKRFTTKYNVERVGGPRNLPKESFYRRQSDGDYHHQQIYAEQAIYYNKYKVDAWGGDEGLPQFRVTLVNQTHAPKATCEKPPRGNNR